MHQMADYPVLLGRNEDEYWAFPGTEHVALHARTGAGKTSNFVIPNCFEWPGSAIILDIKGEVHEYTAGHRYHRLGQKVFVFNPTDPEMRTHRWNPLDAVDRGSIKRFDQIARQAYMLFPEVPLSANGNASFWEDAKRKAFIAGVNLVAETPELPFNIREVLRLFSRGDYSAHMLNRIETKRRLGKPYSALVVEGITDFLSAHPDLVESMRSGITTKLQAFYNPVGTAATETSDFDLRRFRREPTTLYVTVSPGDMPRMRPLLRLLFDQFVNLNTDLTPAQDPSLKVPVLLVLDEFARLGKVETLAESAQFIRGFGLRMLMVVQNKAQIVSLYGENAARDIFDNVGAEIVFGTGDGKLAKELEERIGDNTMMFQTTNKPKFFAWMNLSKQNESEHPHRRPLMLDQEILQMPPTMQLGLRPGMPPFKSERIVWYQDKHFAGLQLPPPIIPPLKVEIPVDDGSISLPQRH